MIIKQVTYYAVGCVVTIPLDKPIEVAEGASIPFIGVLAKHDWACAYDITGNVLGSIRIDEETVTIGVFR